MDLTEEAIAKLAAEIGFHDFVRLVVLWLENYPPDIFTGESGDMGPGFVVALREAVERLKRGCPDAKAFQKPALVGAMSASTATVMCTNCGHSIDAMAVETKRRISAKLGIRLMPPKVCTRCAWGALLGAFDDDPDEDASALLSRGEG